MNIFLMLKYTIMNLSYQKKLLLSYFTFIFIPLLILSLYFCISMMSIQEKQMSHLCELYVKQGSDLLSDRTSEMLKIAKTVAVQDTLRSLLEKEPGTVSVIEQYYDLKEIQDVIDGVYFDDDSYTIRLFVNPEFSYSKRKDLFYPLSMIDIIFPNEKDVIMDMSTMYGPVFLKDKFEECILSVTVPVYGLDDYRETIALVCVAITENTFLDIMKNAEYSGLGEVYLADSSENILLGYSGATNTRIAESDFPSSIDAIQSRFGKNTLMVSASLINGTWCLFSCSSLDSLNNAEKFIPIQIILFSIVLGIIIYFFAYIYAHFNSVRIVQLAALTQKVKQGDLSVRCIVDSSDEIGELQTNFNEMIYQLQSMLESQYQLGKQIKDSELRLLQAQINPHFLYNTLNLISWTAKEKGADKVCDIVNKLSQYYRICLSNGFERISLKDELTHIALYVQLQNMRLEHPVRLKINAKTEVYDYYVLKLLLQPIVENCIMHGFAGNGGIITIDVVKEQEYLLILVADNGIGISPEKQARLRLNLELGISSVEPGGFGMVNVGERLRNYYGEESYLEFFSVPGNGTTVKMLIPIYECMKRTENEI